jgi:WD40 repeat protein
VFAQRFADLYQAAGNPTLKRVADAAEARMRPALARGRSTGVSPQRISDWRSGRNVPARFESLLPVLLTLVGLVRKSGVRPQPELIDVQEWKRLWDAATVWEGDAEDDTVCPYLGLTSYGRADAARFFGRVGATTELADLVRATVDRGEHSGATVLLGASGAGKSSLLAAGLIPELAAPADEWAVAMMTPGAQPLAALMTAIGGNPETPDLVDVTGAITEWGADRRRLLIVDQFEELFTTCDPAQREGLLAALEHCLACRKPYPTAVVLAVRADFYARCLDFPLLQSALADRGYLLGPMRPDELAEAIVRPAELAGLKLEPGLEELAITELCGLGGHEDRLGYEPGALPLLSHVMTAAWRHREGKRLTVAGYRKAGGVAGSVSAAAEHAWGELSETERRAAEHILPALVVVGEESRDTRRIVDRADLLSRAADPEDAAVVLERLAAARLITLDAGSVCLTHEVVLNVWPRLRAWITEGRVGHLVRQRLHADAAEWLKADRDPTLLYRGIRLATVNEHTDPPPVDGTAGQFLTAARDAHRRSARRRAGMRAGLALVCVIVLCTSLFGFAESRRADRERNDAYLAAILAEADRWQDSDPSVSAQLDVAAYRLRPGDPGIRSRLLRSEQEPLASTLTTSAAQGIYQLVYSPDGKTLASIGSTDNDRLTIDLSNVAEPGRPRAAIPLPGAFRPGVAFSPDGKTLATVTGDAALQLWDVSDVTHPRRSPQATGSHAAALGERVGGPPVFSPDGRVVAVQTGDRSVSLVDVSDPGNPVARGSITAPPAMSVKSYAFGPAGSRRVVVVAEPDADSNLPTDPLGTRPTVDNNTTVQWWDASDPDSPAPAGPAVAGLTGPVFAVAFNKDRTMLAISHSDGVIGRDDVGTVQLWNIADTQLPRQLGTITTPGAQVSPLDFSPDGGTLAVSDTGAGISLWRLADPMHPVMHSGLIGSDDAAFSATYSPDGRTLAVGTMQGTAKLWSLPQPGIDVSWPSFARGHDLMLAHAPDGTSEFWDMREPLDPHELGSLGRDVSPLALSPDGRTMIATASPDDRLAIVDIADPGAPRQLAQLPVSEAAATGSVAVFTSDSRYLILDNGFGRDDALTVWDLADRARPVVVAHIGHHALDQIHVSGRTLVELGLTDIRLWDISKPANPVQRGSNISVCGKQLLAAALSPDEHTLITSCEHGIQTWDVHDPNHVVRLGEPIATGTHPALWIAFDPAGRQVATSDETPAVQLWDLDGSGRLTPVGLSIAPAHRDDWSVQFLPGTNYLVGSGRDDLMRVWDLDERHAIHRICALTQAATIETFWHQHLPHIPYQAPCDMRSQEP